MLFRAMLIRRTLAKPSSYNASASDSGK